MNMQMCNNGHFYDAEEYAVCPHCKKEEAEGMFPRTGIVTDFPSTGCYLKQQETTNTDSYPKTVPVSSADNYPKTSPVGSADSYPKTAPISSASSYPKTTPVGNSVEFPKTSPIMGGNAVQDVGGWNPVLGWLVCIQGKKIGKDFKLTQTVNYIGRAASNDICLDFDEEISRDSTVTITYDKQHRVFRLNVEQSQNSVFVNGIPVLAELYLRDKDVISMGNTRLKLVCFCDVSFSWES